MTENDKKPTQAEIEQKIHGQSVDWYLLHLVSLANENGLEFGLTLTVGGSIVSGTLISGKKYFETFASDLSSAWPGDEDAKEIIRSSFAGWSAIYNRKKEDDDDRPPPQYIHLSNARVHTPQGSLPTNTGVLWRGKINAVSGFSLGSFTIGDA